MPTTNGTHSVFPRARMSFWRRAHCEAFRMTRLRWLSIHSQMVKPADKLIICDDIFSVRRATTAAFTRNGRHLVACWNRSGNGFDGAYLSVYQWPTLEHKSTVSLGEDVKPCDLFIGKNANSLYLDRIWVKLPRKINVALLLPFASKICDLGGRRFRWGRTIRVSRLTMRQTVYLFRIRSC